MQKRKNEPDHHPFITNPHRTIIALSFPILLSLIAEPITGLIDTGFVAQLGSVSLAALGVGTGALSSVFWIFGFLGIGTQTEVAQTYGKGKIDESIKAVSLAMTLGVVVSLILIGLLIPGAPLISSLIGAKDAVLDQATHYIQLRLFGAPAVIITIVGFWSIAWCSGYENTALDRARHQYHEHHSRLPIHIWLGIHTCYGRWRCGDCQFNQSMVWRIVDAMDHSSQIGFHAEFQSTRRTQPDQSWTRSVYPYRVAHVVYADGDPCSHPNW